MPAEIRQELSELRDVKEKLARDVTSLQEQNRRLQEETLFTEKRLQDQLRRLEKRYDKQRKRTEKLAYHHAVYAAERQNIQAIIKRLPYVFIDGNAYELVLSFLQNFGEIYLSFRFLQTIQRSTDHRNAGRRSQGDFDG